MNYLCSSSSILRQQYGDDYQIINPQRFAAFEDHLIYSDDVSKFVAFKPLIQELRALQKEFIVKNGLKDYSAKNGIFPGICHEVAREDMNVPGDFILATDSHRKMTLVLSSCNKLENALYKKHYEKNPWRFQFHVLADDTQGNKQPR